MAATKVGILYSITQRRRRVLVVPDSDAQLPLKPRAGEAYIEQSISDYRQRGPDAAVQDAAGGPPLSDRCAIVNGTAVVGMVHADPAIDALKSFSLVATDAAKVGDTYSTGVFSRQFIQVNAAGIVTALPVAPITQRPIAANVGGFVLEVGDLPTAPKIGDKVATTVASGNPIPPPSIGVVVGR